MVPRTIAGRYELGGRLGRGGVGEVWAAFDTVLRRDVAVKTVDLDAADDPVARERFQREALATASLSHVNIVTVFDAGIDRSTAYLVMELLPGPTLAALVAEQGALSVDLATRYAAQAAAALSASHAVGVIHRDIKPSNLMLDAYGQLKVVDFGIARLTQTRSAQLTATMTVLGSAPYMAPEQVQGELASQPTDVYALGCVLTTLLTGYPPFTGEHPVAVAHQHLRQPAPKIRDRRPDIPQALDSLVDQMLAKQPYDRPADMGEVRARLDALADPLAVETAVLLAPTQSFGSEPNGTRVPTSSDESTSILPSIEHVSPPRRPGRRGMAMLALLGLVVLVAGLVWAIDSLWGDSKAGDTATSPASGQQGSTSTGPSTTSPSSTGSPPSTSSASPRSTVADAVAALRSAVESLAESGQADEKVQDELSHGVDEIEKSLENQDSKDLAHQIDEFTRDLDHLVDKGEIGSQGRRQVESALTDLEQFTADE